jgi:TetR/AcrR family tetracycline transcriptional repressor
MPVDRDGAVRVALRLLDADGLDKLTLRRIATELGVQAPALYWHFASKRALLDHVTDAMVAPHLDAVPPPAPDQPWDAWLATLAAALRRALLAHRDGARVASGAGLVGAAGLGQFVERTTAALHAAGFPAPQAVRAAGALMAFVIGRTVEEQTLPADEAGAVALLATRMPTVARALRESAARGDTQDDAFTYSLTIFLTGLRTLHDKLPENPVENGRSAPTTP